MLKEHNTTIRNFMRILDVMVIVCAFLLSYHIRRQFHVFYKLNLFPSVEVVKSQVVSFDQYLSFLILIVPIWVLILNLLGAYKSIRTKSYLDISLTLVKSAVYTTFAFGALAFILKIQYVSRVLFVIFIFLSFFLLGMEKWILILVIRYIRRKGYNYRRVLIIGSGARAQNFIKLIERHPEWGFKIVGVVDNDRGKINQEVLGYSIIGILEDIPDILHKRAIDNVVFVVPRSWLDKIQNSIAACELEGVRTTLAVDLFDLEIAHATQEELEGIPLMTFETTPARENQLFIKRTMDFIISVLVLIMLSPIFLIFAILIKLTSRGPVLFVQRRVGSNGRKFILYKFRSMYYGSHKKLKELEKLNEQKGPIFKIKDDPRITPPGRFMRKFSIDELPQFFNVLMGHMSLVGPRPPLPHEVEKYEPWQRRRLSMRPGLTCLWQVGGRSKISFDEWMKLDLKYIDNWSLWLDIKILIKTIPVLIFGIGAH